MSEKNQKNTQPENALVEVEGLSISYAAGNELVPVAKEITFTLFAGEALALVGESGSGKSTVASALLGSLRAGSHVISGQVRVLGQNVFELDPAGLKSLRGGQVALVGQNAGHSLTPSMRVGQQIAETLKAHGRDGSRVEVEKLGQRVHLRDSSLLNRYPHELSGGQQQRIAIAIALAGEPRVLVLDEPTTALDVITQRGILDLIEQLRRQLQVAVVLVSHDLGVVAEVADTALVMSQGEVIEAGPCRKVLGQPEHDYTKRLTQAAPVLTQPVPTAPALTVQGIGRSEFGSAPRGAAALDLPPAKPMLSCTDVSVRYARRSPDAVRNFSAEVQPGETLAIVGQSGSGKSTLARALAGILPIRAGQASLNLTAVESGATTDSTLHPIVDLTAPVRGRSALGRRAVQMVFQNADLALNPRRTVADSIRRPLQVFGVAKGKDQQRERVESLLTEVGLNPAFASRYPGQLSGGQRQRVGIARALAADPSLLIADEITTALDVSVQAEILDLLEELKVSRELSCLFISHDLAVVQRISDRIAVMNQGETVEVGPSEQILQDPKNEYTRELLEATVHLDVVGL